MSENRGRGSKIVRFSIFVATLLLVTGCSGISSRRTKNPGADANAIISNDAVLTGVVLQNETSERRIVIQELGSDIQVTLDYDAATIVTDKFEMQIEAEKIEAGEIMEAAYDSSKGKIVSMQIPKDAWEYQEVSKYSLDNEEKSIQVAGEKYQYSNLTYIGSSNHSIEMMELNKQDVLTVRGVGYTVYSIVRTQGHGYIRLKNYSEFVGGMISVGNGIILPITDNMLITAKEGTYRVILSKRSMSAMKTVTVQLDKECIVDFSDYQPATKNVGNITFQIEPKGADLTINGTAVNYSKPILLNYGTYSIEVSLTGYTSYSGTLDVEEASSIVSIDLIDEKTQVASSATSTPGSDSSDDDNVTTKQIDSDHTITVSAPEGAEVYLDNVYKGLAPCTFTKVIGSQTLTLSKEGYVTKSYSIDILDDDKNTKLSFSDLVESTSTATASPASTATATTGADG